jgi:hypothetical protein
MSILCAQESQYHSSILVLQLENWKVFIVDHCIQYERCTANPDNFITLLGGGWNRHHALCEMMTHIPMCSVAPEPSYVLILNTRPTAARATGRNDTLLMGYAILQQLLQGYHSLLYKVIFVEKDTTIWQVWEEFWDAGLFNDDRVQVVHTNPHTYLQDCVPGRFQVVFVTHDFSEEDAVVKTHTDPWTMVQHSLVPGGLACTLISDHSLLTHHEVATMDPWCTIEYARLPSLHPTRLLRLHRRKTTTTALQPTCQIPLRQPILSPNVTLLEYSAATHRAAFVLPPCLQSYQSVSSVERIEAEGSNVKRHTVASAGSAQQQQIPSISPDKNYSGDDAEGNGSRSQHFGCLEHENVASLFQQVMRLPNKEDAIAPIAPSSGEGYRENGDYSMDRRYIVGKTQECFSIFPRPSCVIQ